MKYVNGLAKEEFLQHMYEEFPTVFDNTFSRDLLSNIIEYGSSNHVVTKNGLYYFLKNIIPEAEPGDLIPFIDKQLLTDEVLCLVNETEPSLVVVKTMDELKTYLEENGWSVYGDEDDWEIRQASPAGEDFFFDIVHNNDVKEAVNELKRYAYEFDIDEHVQLNLGMRGAPGVSELVEDAKELQKMLDDLAENVNWCEQKTIRETLAEAQERSVKNNSETTFKKNEYYKVSDGFFDFYVNKQTGEKKTKLEENDILVDRNPDDFLR